MNRINKRDLSFEDLRMNFEKGKKTAERVGFPPRPLSPHPSCRVDGKYLLLC